MSNNRPSKRAREAQRLLGHLHSPPTNSKAIRKANIQAVLSQSPGIVWKSDTPSPLRNAAAKSPFVKAYVNLKGQGQGTPKPKIAKSIRFTETCESSERDDSIGRVVKRVNAKGRTYKATNKQGKMRHGMGNQHAQNSEAAFGIGRQSHLPKRTGDDYGSWFKNHPDYDEFGKRKK